MRTIVFILILFAFLPSAAALDLYYNVTMTYDKGDVTLDSVSVVPLEEYDTEFYRSLNYYSATIAGDDTVLGIYYFDFNLVLYAVFADENGTVIDSREFTKDNNTISAYFPYGEDASTVIIRDYKLNELLRIDLKATEILAEKVVVEKPPEKKVPLNYLLTAILFFVLLFVLWAVFKKKRTGP